VVPKHNLGLSLSEYAPCHPSRTLILESPGDVFLRNPYQTADPAPQHGSHLQEKEDLLLGSLGQLHLACHLLHHGISLPVLPFYHLLASFLFFGRRHNQSMLFMGGDLALIGETFCHRNSPPTDRSVQRIIKWCRI